VRVPDEADKGNAKVTLSFPDWKEGNVAPAMFEVPIVEPEPKKQQKETQPAPKAAGKK
jgi:hypothetical protein